MFIPDNRSEWEVFWDRAVSLGLVDARGGSEYVTVTGKALRDRVIKNALVNGTVQHVFIRAVTTLS